MENNTALVAEILKAGWVFGHKDEFPGDRIYPAYNQSKTIPMRDVRAMADGSFMLHNPWKGVEIMRFACLSDVLAHVEQHGAVTPAGCNVWD